jgi:hypothetical protein
VSRTGIDHEQAPGSFGVAAHDPILGPILIVRSGAEKDIELGSVLRRDRARDSRTSESGTAAGIARKRDVRCSVNVSLGRETDVELKRRRVDFDIPVPKKLRKSLGGESLQLSLPVRVLEDMCICWSPKRPTNGRRAEATRLLFSKRPPMSSRNLDRLVRLFNLNVPGTITMENEIPPMLPAQRLFAPSPSPSDPYTSQPRGPTQLPLLSVQRRARKRLRLQIEIVGNPRSLRRRVVSRSCKSAGGVFSSSRSRTDWYGLPLVTVALDPDPTVSPVTTRRQLSIGSE